MNGVANSFGNNVAGVFRSAVPAGYYCDILIRGRNIPVAAVSGTDGGESVIADTTANTASADSVAVGTATTYQKLGIVRTSVVASVAYVDFDIPNIP
jgi:hypothetical protein